MRNQIYLIIPCYNEERLIKKCLESIVENDYAKDKKDKKEILVVDGISKDGAMEIVKE